MKKLFIFSIYILAFILSCYQPKKNSPKAINGILDLEAWEFERDGNLKLEGEWEFYWGELLEPKNFKANKDCSSESKTCDSSIPRPDYIKIPSLWTQQNLKESTLSTRLKKNEFGNMGYATYRLKIKNIKEKVLSLYLYYINTAYKLFINGELITEVGRVGKTKEESIPSQKSLDYTFESLGEDVEIVLQVSNYFHRAGGTWEPFLLGKPKSLYLDLIHTIISDIFICGVLTVMGMYHIGLYSLRKKDLSPFWFGLFCISLSIRSLVTGSQVIYIFQPNMSYLTGLRLEYLTIYFGTPFFTLYFNTVFQKEKLKISYLFIYGPFLLSLPVIFLNSEIFTHHLKYLHVIILFSLVYGIYCSVRGVLNKTLGAITFLVGFTIFALTILNDVLYANNVLSIGLLTPLGLSIFIFSQSFLLSTKFSKAFSDSEIYGKELEVLSENLEEKVNERTLELQNEKKIAEELQNQAEAALMILKTTQSQLIEAERMASLGQLVGGVAHEINNPIGVIRSNSELISSNILLTISKFPLFFQSLARSEQLLFQNILEQSLLNKEFLSSKEERQRKKEIKYELEEIITNSNENIDFIAEQILLLKLKSPLKTLVVEMGEEKFLESLSIAQIFINQSNSIGNIEIAVEKVSRVVFALRSYLNTEMYHQRKEIDLISEIEKSLHVYDNYIIGKVVVLKEFPKELTYPCIPENLSQVWKNIIFNAIQAMYLTEKKLEIKVQILKQIPENITQMKSSLNLEIVNNSINQKLDWVLISFVDSGEGIVLDNQDKLFSPFFTTKALGEGIGLGLYVSKKIIHEHGGIIYFESKKSTTNFIIALPFM